MIINNRQGENGTAESEIDLLALAALLWDFKLVIIIATLLLAAGGKEGEYRREQEEIFEIQLFHTYSPILVLSQTGFCLRTPLLRLICSSGMGRTVYFESSPRVFS